MKKYLNLIFLLLLSISLSAQIDLNKVANEEYHRVAQIEGTEDILKDYFSGISNPNDTLYVFLCQLMSSPRLEGYMTTVQEWLYIKNPNNPMVMIASFQNENAARKYVENKFFFEEVIYDTDKSFKSFLAFSTEDPRVPFLMKIDRKSGRLLTGGDYVEISRDFINALINHNEYMPFYGEVWSEKLNFNHSMSDCENESFKTAELYAEVTIPLEEDTFVSSVAFPNISNGFLSFADDLDNSIYLYSLDEKCEDMTFVGTYKPNETEEMLYVSIDRDLYKKRRDMGAYIAMCLTSVMKDSETILFSVSLPNIFYEDINIKRTAYYNQAAVISQNINNKDDRKLIPLEFNNDHTKLQFISHQGFRYSPDLDKYFFATIMDYDPTLMTFKKEAYEDRRIYSIYDAKDNKVVGGIGQLGQINMDLNVGWTYIYPSLSLYGNKIAVSDGNSGDVLVYNDENLNEPSYKVKVFDVNLSDFEIDSSLTGTEEYFFQFQDDFKNYVLDVEMNSKNLYTLSLEDGCHFKKIYDKKGRLKKTFLIPGTHNTYPLEIGGLCTIDGKVYVKAFYFDGEKHTMLLF